MLCRTLQRINALKNSTPPSRANRCSPDSPESKQTHSFHPDLGSTAEPFMKISRNLAEKLNGQGRGVFLPAKVHNADVDYRATFGLRVRRKKERGRGVAIPLFTRSESGFGIAKRLKIQLRIRIQGWNHNTARERGFLRISSRRACPKIALFRPRSLSPLPQLFPLFSAEGRHLLSKARE